MNKTVKKVNSQYLTPLFEKTWICEITDGTQIDMKVEIAPKWVYEYLLDVKDKKFKKDNS